MNWIAAFSSFYPSFQTDVYDFRYLLVSFSSRERQDSEIAQEIQVKLVFEAEQRRRQEEKDEVTLKDGRATLSAVLVQAFLGY